MSVSNKILKTGGGKLKPILKKILPMKVSRALKQKTIDAGMKEITARGRVPFDRSLYPDGINAVGLFKAQMGLGQGARLMGNVIRESGIDATFHSFELNSGVLQEQDHSYDGLFTDEYKYNINVFHVNPEEISYLYLDGDRKIWDGRYNIGFWLWELEHIPASWLKYLPMLDEIWTPSEYISRNIRRVTDLPVYTVPYPVDAEADEKYDRRYFHLPQDRFLFLVMYDSNSTMERKNPIGAIKAYRAAFRDREENTGLVIKINNPSKRDVDRLKKELKGLKHVYIITKTLDKTEVNSLINDVDVMVSLHRAEGFGLVMAEAMLLKTPCIATDYSSNTEFMDRKSACMVDWRYTTVKKDAFPYKKGEKWAEPNLNTAARYMRKLATDKDYYRLKQDKGFLHARRMFDPVRIESIFEERIEEIYTGGTHA